MVNRLNVIGISLVVLVLTGSLIIINFQAYATGCYDSNNFIFNWFSLNDVLACLDAGTGTGESNTASCDSYLYGVCLFAQKVGVDLQFKKLVSANGLLTITSNSSNVIFTNNVSGESTVCGNAGAGTTIHISLTNCNAKSLLAGTGITIASNSTVITITNNSPETTDCTSAGGQTIVKTSSGGDCTFYGLVGSSDIAITQQTNTIKVDFNGTDNNFCTSTGTGEAICESSNNINSLIATSPLTVSDTTGDLTLACDTCWIQLDNSSPADGATTWTSGTFTAKKYMIWQLYIKNDVTTVTAGNIGIRFNGDTGSNYDGSRYVGGTRTATTGQTSIIFCSLDENFAYYSTSNIFNSASLKKGINAHLVPLEFGNTAGNQECEVFGDWQNTSNAITSITLLRLAGTWAFDSTSIMVIYGHD